MESWRNLTVRWETGQWFWQLIDQNELVPNCQHLWCKSVCVCVCVCVYCYCFVELHGCPRANYKLHKLHFDSLFDLKDTHPEHQRFGHWVQPSTQWGLNCQPNSSVTTWPTINDKKTVCTVKWCSQRSLLKLSFICSCTERKFLHLKTWCFCSLLKMHILCMVKLQLL